MKKRLYYAVATLLLLCIETCIALYVHDDFVRPYVGDMLVVIVLYMFVRIFVPEKVRLLPLYVFLFAAGVELLQYFDIVRLLGLAGNRFFRILIGSVFDLKDILCYAAGCLVLAGGEAVLGRCICLAAGKDSVTEGDCAAVKGQAAQEK